MNFHNEVERLIQQDEKDNCIIQSILKQLLQTQEQYSKAQQKISQMSDQINHLRQINNQLEERLRTKAFTLSAKEDPKSFKQSLIAAPLSQTYNSYFNLQHTKRKVINGFVAELTSEIENSDEMLIKQRMMMDELRKGIQACNQENLKLRSWNKSLEDELKLLSLENKELMAELSEAQIHRETREAENLLGRQDYKYLRISPRTKGMQIQGELHKMDEIYRQIELQLAN